MSKNTHLIEGEKFDIDEKLDHPETPPSDDEINQKYKRGEIRIITEQARYPLDTIKTMLDSKQGDTKKYILNPEYQRRKRWDNIRKSRLIESFIMNVPIPPIFLYEVDYSIYEVMDGQQRLTSIYNFYEGKFELKGLEYWQELNGKKYNDLPEQVKRGIDRRYLSSIVLLEETAKTKEEAENLKRIVFERLNSGGEKLTPQEIRNALFNGDFNQLCIDLAKNDYFRKMWKLPLESEGEKKLLANKKYRQMEDVELVLRFFAYRHWNKITTSINQSLDNYLQQANDYPSETKNCLKNLFNETINLIYSIFEEDAFLLPQQGKNKPQIGKIVYDSMMQVFTNNILHKENLLKNTNKIRSNLYSNDNLLYFQEGNERKYIFDTRYHTGKYLKLRIDYFDNFLKQYI